MCTEDLGCGLEALLYDARMDSQICPTLGKRGRLHSLADCDLARVQQGVIPFDLMKPFNLTWFKKLECKNSYLKFHIHCFLVFSDRMHSLSP